MKNLKTFIKIYNENIESEYIKKTTKLTDEHIQTESLKKLAGNWFKTGLKKRKMLKQTIFKVLNKYKFQQREDDNGELERNIYEKQQGKYDIYIEIDIEHFNKNNTTWNNNRYCDLKIIVLNAKTKTKLGEQVVEVKYTFTEEELINEINEVLDSICDQELTTDSQEVQKVNATNDKYPLFDGSSISMTKAVNKLKVHGDTPRFPTSRLVY